MSLPRPVSHPLPALLRSLALPAALLLAALVAFLGAPDSRIAALNCGTMGEILCKETKVCKGSILLLNRCKTTYAYWHEDNPAEDEEGEEGEGSEEPESDGTVH